MSEPGLVLYYLLKSIHTVTAVICYVCILRNRQMGQIKKKNLGNTFFQLAERSMRRLIPLSCLQSECEGTASRCVELSII